jgi:hypothetical protein
MAENNFFGIEDDFVESESVNDALFSDALTDDTNLQSIKDKEAADAKKKEEEEKKKAEEAKKATATKQTPPAKKEGEASTTKDKDEAIEEVDAEESLFGEPDKGKKPGVAEKTETEEEPEVEIEEGDKSQFELLSESLYKAGIFKGEVDEDTGEETTHIAKTPEEFKKLFEGQLQMGMYQMINTYLSRFGEDRQQLFDAIYEKGVDPKEYLPVYNTLQSFKGLSIEADESNQEKVVREFYTRAGIPEDKINKKIQTLKDTSYLQDEAETFLPQIIQQDEDRLKKQEADKEANRVAEEQKDAHYKTSIVKILTEKIKAKEFDGIPLTEKRAQQAFDYLYNKKWQSGDKKYTDFDKFILELNRPENHALKVKIGLLALDNFDLSKVKKQAISTESNELFSELTTKKTKQANKQKATAPADWNL